MQQCRLSCWLCSPPEGTPEGLLTSHLVMMPELKLRLSEPSSRPSLAACGCSPLWPTETARVTRISCVQGASTSIIGGSRTCRPSARAFHDQAAQMLAVRVETLVDAVKTTESRLLTWLHASRKDEAAAMGSAGRAPSGDSESISGDTEDDL